MAEMTPDKPGAMPDEIYAGIDTDGSTFWFSTSHEYFGIQTKYIRAQTEPVVNGETPNTEHNGISEQQPVHKPASDAALATFDEMVKFYNMEGSFDVSEIGSVRSALQAPVVDAEVLKEDMVAKFSHLNHSRGDAIRSTIDHLIAQGLVIKKGGENA